MRRTMLVVGNWKMHGVSGDMPEIEAIAAVARDTASVDSGLCLPATLIERAVRAVPGFPIGAQDLHQADRGAHTGCTSAEMLADAGATMAIVGHSERREAQCESDADVRAKAQAGLAAGLLTILCVGESLDVREAGDAVATVGGQLEASLPAVDDIGRLAVAYEPIWAIGTGKTATAADIGEMHGALRQRLLAVYGDKGAGVRILYGGSVKAANAAEIFAVDDVDGALVGGASLKAADFVPIIEAAALKA
ncbi:triose-phosphate isomerase [Sphingomonas sabuli]|uniref:Triosephosphate isomerase n=1 Tax=Sphingomonas sabuli TaxID=2764186 RepID=A0A7G9L2W8_9SPHN|nr:triose-phosphate isomerase [Sphingomonas sabuli]QNM82967.1 triose-phosphate isomerase [Sphingomonas sabuli]